MGRLRSAGSALCIVIAMLLVPAGVVSGWAKAELLDENAFARTFGPLATDPAMQAEVSKQAMSAIERSIDIDGLTADIFDGIIDLGLSPRASTALRMLEQPAAAGVRNMLQDGVSEFVHSELFAAAWERSLRLSHRALLAAATQDSLAGGALTIDRQGEVAIQLAPIIEEVKRSLQDRGFGLAAAIPAVSASIVVAQSDALATIGLIYALTSVLGWWLPVIALLLFVSGVLLARKRPIAITGTGIALLVGAGTLLFVFAFASAFLQASAFRLGVSAAALEAVFSHTVAGMRASSWWLVVLGVLLVVAGRALGPAKWAVRLREWLREWPREWPRENVSGLRAGRSEAGSEL